MKLRLKFPLLIAFLLFFLAIHAQTYEQEVKKLMGNMRQAYASILNDPEIKAMPEVAAPLQQMQSMLGDLEKELLQSGQEDGLEQIKLLNQMFNQMMPMFTMTGAITDQQVQNFNTSLRELEESLGNYQPASSNVTISGERLEPAAHAMLEEILRSAGLSSARVSSYKRSQYDQARVMYDAMASRGSNGPSYARNTYHASSHPIIAVYENNPGLSKSERISLMQAEVAKVIQRYANQIRPTLRHVSPQHYYTFDVAPSSISNAGAFLSAVRSHPNFVRLIPPKPGTTEDGYHIELRR